MDFVCEMYAADNPNEMTFTRTGDKVLTDSERLAAWDAVLVGKARTGIMPTLPLDAIRRFNKTVATTMEMIEDDDGNG